MVLLMYQTSARCRLWLIGIWQGVTFGVRYMNAPSHVSIIFSSNTWKPHRLRIVSTSCESWFKSSKQQTFGDTQQFVLNYITEKVT
jgi:hypothetical protein